MRGKNNEVHYSQLERINSHHVELSLLMEEEPTEEGQEVTSFRVAYKKAGDLLWHYVDYDKSELNGYLVMTYLTLLIRSSFQHYILPLSLIHI